MRARVVGSLFTVSLLTVQLSLAACGGDEPDPCVPYCDAERAAKCGDIEASCASDCRTGIEGWADEGKACESQFEEHLGCLAKLTFHCENGITLPPGDACASAEEKLNACLGIDPGGK